MLHLPFGKASDFSRALCEHGIVLGKGSKTAITYSMRVCSLTWYLKNNLEKRTRTSLTTYCFLTQFFLSCRHFHLLLTLPGASRRMGGVWGGSCPSSVVSTSRPSLSHAWVSSPFPTFTLPMPSTVL